MMLEIEILKLTLAMAALEMFRRCQNKWRNAFYLVMALSFLSGSVMGMAQH